MKKKSLSMIVVFAMILIVLLAIVSGCDNNQSKPKTISFYDGEKLVDSIKTAGKETITLPIAEVKEGYEFAGWYFDKDVWQDQLTSDYYSNTALTEDKEVYAYYRKTEEPQPEKYLVSFVENGGSEVIDMTVSVIESSPYTEQEGYRFLGWYTESNFVNEVTFPYQVTRAQTLYAKWEKIEYTISFYDGEKLVDSIKTAGKETITLPVAEVKEGYEFVGWYFDKDVWQDQLTSDYYANTTLTEDKEVYAYYRKTEEPQPEKYLVSFVENGGSEVKDMTVSVIESSPFTEQEGYRFLGWYTEINFVNEVTFPYQVTRAQTLYAKWEKIEYTISFYDGEKLVDSIKTAGKETITLPIAEVKEGYEFVGWYFDKDVWQDQLTSDYYANTTLTEDKEVYAYYRKTEEPQPEKYLVSFVENGGSEVKDMTVSVIESSPYTEQEGYRFLGWYTESNFINEVTFPYQVTSAQTLYAKWEKIEPEQIEFVVNSQGLLTQINNLGTDPIELIIPEQVNGTKIVSISNYLLQYNNNITKIVFPDSLKSLGMGVCRYCTNLQEVVLPANLTIISESAFQGCEKLESITLPQTLETISNDALRYTGLREVDLPASMRKIGNYAFYGCENLIRINLANVTDMGEGVFEYCTSLKSIVFPDTIKNMDGNYMFMGCSSLASVKMPNVAIPIAYSFLNNTLYYDTPSNWQDGVLYVDGYLLCVNNDFVSKTSYTVKEGTKVIANNAMGAGFTYNLKSITLPQGLQIIGSEAFYRCSQLNSANIPQSVDYVGVDAFASTAIMENKSIVYLDNWLLKYDSTDPTITVQDGTVGIAEGRVFSNSQATSVVLPDSLKYIGSDNFNSMRQLTSIKMSASLERIGQNAFVNCSSLSSIDLRNCKNLKTIGNTAFSWCTSIKELYIPKSVQFMGSKVFNQINGVVVNFEIAQSQIPKGWNSDWNFTYASTPVIVNWGVEF